ncbi:hypothetical protein BH23ACT3_BH23ACT3_09410 [soil metagenome]
MLVPDEFPMVSLRNDEERMVVQALCDRLTDSWLVIPALGLSGDHRDREIDVAVAHERDGGAGIEVKGHRPQVRNESWTNSSLTDSSLRAAHRSGPAPVEASMPAAR